MDYDFTILEAEIIRLAEYSQVIIGLLALIVGVMFAFAMFAFAFMRKR